MRAVKALISAKALAVMSSLVAVALVGCGADGVTERVTTGGDAEAGTGEEAPAESGAGSLGEPPTDGGAGVPFTYWDGDQQRTVYLKLETSGTTMQERGDPLGGSETPRDSLAAEGVASDSGEDMVFVSESGAEMQLPGGMIVLLDPGWSPGQVSVFFAEHGIEQYLVSELDWIDNGFLVYTEPGLAALQLANSLVGQPGVEMSMPDWAVEADLK